MKTFLYGSMLCVATLLPAVASAATSTVGQCVFPRTKPAANGNLVLAKPVSIFAAPNESSASQPLKALSAFTIKAERDGFIQLVTVPDDSAPNPDAEAGKVVGWVHKTDFVMQDLRNCQ
jgi:hypothetical protein